MNQTQMRNDSKICAQNLENFVNWTPDQDIETGPTKLTELHGTTESVLQEFGLYLRFHSRKSEDYHSMFLASFKYFWFLPVNITVVLDDTPEEKNFSKQIIGKFPHPKIYFAKEIDPKKNKPGDPWLLQQLSLFCADEYVDYKYS